MATARLKHENQDKTAQSNWKKLCKEADQIFLGCEYEQSLVLYHRAQRLRPHSEDVRIGILKCEEALDNLLKSKRKLIKKKHKQDDPNDAPQRIKSFTEWAKSVSGNSKKRTKSPGRVAQERREDARHAKKLYNTKMYFEELLHEIDTSNFKGEDIKELVHKETVFIDHHCKFWKNRVSPEITYYNKLPRKRHKNKEKSLAVKDSNLKHNIDELLQLLKAFHSHNYNTVISLSEVAIPQVEAMSYLDIENKDEVLLNLYSVVGCSHFELGNSSEAMNWHELELNTARKRNILDSQSRALGNIGRIHMQEGHCDRAIEVWKEKVLLCQSDPEKAWLFHEMGYCYLTLGDAKQAKNYGTKSHEAAVKADIKEWMMNSLILVAQTEVVLGHLKKACLHFRDSLDLAMKLKEQETADKIKEALEDIKTEVAMQRKQLQGHNGGQQTNKDSSSSYSIQSSVILEEEENE